MRGTRMCRNNPAGRSSAALAAALAIFAGAAIGPVGAARAMQDTEPAVYPRPPREPVFVPFQKPKGTRGIGVSRDLGIGTSSRANTDMLSTPKPKRYPTTTIRPPRWDDDVVIADRPVARYPRVIERSCRPKRPVVVEGGGLTVEGRYRGEKWDVGFRLGGADRARRLPRGRVRAGDLLGHAAWYASSDAWGTQYVVGMTGAMQAPAGIDPNLMPGATGDASTGAQGGEANEVPEELTPLQKGLEALWRGESGAAVTILRDALKTTPEDAQAMRWLAFALLEENRFDDAAGVMKIAYGLDEKLAGEPIDFDGLEIEAARVRKGLEKAVRHGHRRGRARGCWRRCWRRRRAGRTWRGRCSAARKPAGWIGLSLRRWKRRCARRCLCGSGRLRRRAA